MGKISHLGCKTSCIYTSDDDDDAQEYCFADGELVSECVTDGHPLPILGYISNISRNCSVTQMGELFPEIDVNIMMSIINVFFIIF